MPVVKTRLCAKVDALVNVTFTRTPAGTDRSDGAKASCSPAAVLTVTSMVLVAAFPAPMAQPASKEHQTEQTRSFPSAFGQWISTHAV